MPALKIKAKHASFFVYSSRARPGDALAFQGMFFIIPLFGVASERHKCLGRSIPVHKFSQKQRLSRECCRPYALFRGSIVGHGVSNDSRQALRSYEQNNLAVLSPLNTAIANSTVKTISLDQTKVLLRSYQQQVGETLANYTAQTYSPAAAAVFYNSDIGYSQEMKDEFAKALSQKGGLLLLSGTRYFFKLTLHKVEGRSGKDEGASKRAETHTSSLILHPSSFTLHPSPL